ncbi:hypothetical protein OGH69_04155 [Flavobacterium sp. MFBS3-15]|uniref:ankyrin repeat domain-containing protein n=1 Tax=Flavobacterium sp. MFBS3-15 TaxID=2989816 RepID=UPI002235975B|nr:hypothetical protein [Flavobacterium sp. MFBS3-15]MCW4468149.1 hypothetical protein [Flavobacterium sp. MFBS3-15]
MINNLNNEQRRQFGIDVYKGHFDAVVQTMSQYNIDVNELVYDDKNENIIFQCISGVDHNDNIRLIKHLLDNGANPNIKSRSGYNAFHSILYMPKHIELVSLMLDNDVEVNSQDGQGYTAFHLFLKHYYGALAWKGIPLKMQCLAILEKFLQKGADPDILNNYGTPPRNEPVREMRSVTNLFSKYDAMGIEKPVPVKQERKTNLKYPEVGKEIWAKYVPRSGASETVQGELLRSIEKLRDEAQRNGNGNYGAMHMQMADYIATTLIASGMFDEKEINDDIKPLTYKTKPYLEDDIYDRFCDRICEFYLKYPEPIYINQNQNG